MRGARGLGRFNPSLGVSCRAAGLQSLYFFSGTRRGRGAKGERARGWKEDEWAEEKKNSPSLRMGLARGPALGRRWGRSQRPPPRSRAARRAPGKAPRSAAWPRASAGRRGPAVPGAGRGGHRWRPGARRGMGSGRGEAGRRPPGSRTPEQGSIVVGAEGRGSEAASEARGAAPWSLSRRVPGEAVMAAPWERGAGLRRGEARLHGVLLCLLERPASGQSPPSILLR